MSALLAVVRVCDACAVLGGVAGGGTRATGVDLPQIDLAVSGSKNVHCGSFRIF